MQEIYQAEHQEGKDLLNIHLALQWRKHIIQKIVSFKLYYILFLLLLLHIYDSTLNGFI